MLYVDPEARWLWASILLMHQVEVAQIVLMLSGFVVPRDVFNEILCETIT